MISDAVDSSLASKVVGYKIAKGNFGQSTPNLPQRIVILGEANSDMQSVVDFDEKIEVLSSAQSGKLFGYGSPIHMVLNILRPLSGSGVAGIPTLVYAQKEASGATAKVLELSATGTATANVTHVLKVAGRSSVNGENYAFTINTGDTEPIIHQKIEDAINAVLGSPVTATSTAYETVITSKWKGLTANDITIEIDTRGNDAGISYSVSEIQAGSGTPSVQAALNDFGNDWNTVVINTYGLNTLVTDALEAFNGIPKEENPTGRYAGIVFKPFLAFSGYTDIDMSAATAFTNARKEEVTIAVCPTPGSKGMQFEGAANFAALYAPLAQNKPHLDISGQYLPDMPTPSNIGDMDDYISRDAILKKGCSTVELNSGNYKVMDFVTTYHPDGELPPQFRYVRNLTIDWNVNFSYWLLEQRYVVDHVIAKDSDIVTADKVIKTSSWKQILTTQLFPDLSRRGVITDVDFSVDSLQVGISETNPDRFETSFSYKRTGFARIASTTAKAGFNFGN